jgi:hypothetical protein
MLKVEKPARLGATLKFLRTALLHCFITKSGEWFNFSCIREMADV